MRNGHTSSLLALCMLLRVGQGQLVIPAGLPSTSANFRLRVHAAANHTILGTNVENWVLATSGQRNCNQIGTLVNDGSPGQTFFVNVESGTIQSEADGRRRILTLEENHDKEKVLKLECGEEAISELGIDFPNSVPTLVLERDNDSQFYACQDETGGIGVFYRAAQNEALRSGCADISLILECATGPNHGAMELAVCCVRVDNGSCLSK
ncbi:hypothetical protein NLG97_g4221 [Lecanicillium saksenae]|uniref:Uncharacterized protein n=1 Tax=Lecanicillium saksenae TaxID=468837 RepID=A0ACC1QWG8_9HYPO|nr:hypothetical protein NLG97_g4221 [Lecanicillium saksenae]